MADTILVVSTSPSPPPALPGHRVRAVEVLLQPTVGQTRDLDSALWFCRDIYNAALQERIGAYRHNARSVTKNDQFGQLTGWDHPLLNKFGTRPARGSLVRLDLAFQGFFRRVKSGAAPGFPRFKGRDRFDSITYSDRGCWKVTDQRLYVKGVGHVKYRCSKKARQYLTTGDPRTLTVKREGRRWRTYIAVRVPVTPPRPRTGKWVGVDVGGINLVATSDGDLTPADRPYKNNQNRLAAAQRKRERAPRGSRRRANERVARLHRKVRNQRRNMHHHVTRRLVDGYDLIAHEDLKVSNMVRSPAPKPDPDQPGQHLPNGAASKAGLNTTISDAGWGLLLNKLGYKAEEAGVELIPVPPHHTSQTCAACGHVNKENRVTQAEFECVKCGHTDHADVNAARNILRAGQALRSTQTV